MNQVIETPKKEAFYFGLYVCAYCLGSVFGKNRKRHVLKSPEFADVAETEIIIPAGRQSFHKECLDKLKKESK